eukprot:CAMPEP_0114583648 /NCGR_PEP_ID=MMETSP0125-20121206/7343_1 /TAXON_ID=485358 ORGANISM="Aristerostoma sp., Strain ATCC 50986" /NCGR_SAMPLE_ID=MMETSP0125 /ASSEMBLY_ACC=CAM_ASM_000245 /LENGTH=33 /DNA_ID= /DNA_START= /DNA_END= /DNA_ORIENTATION=
MNVSSTTMGAKLQGEEEENEDDYLEDVDMEHLE